MTAFGRSDLDSICISAESGGCGKTHERGTIGKGKEKQPAPVFAVDCGICEPILLSPLHGWMRRPELVELTYDEGIEKERMEAEGNKMQAIMARELGGQLAGMVATRSQGE